MPAAGTCFNVHVLDSFSAGTPFEQFTGQLAHNNKILKGCDEKNKYDSDSFAAGNEGDQMARR